MKDRPRHTNDETAIFFDEVAGGTDSAVQVNCAEKRETHRGDLRDTQWFMGVPVRAVVAWPDVA